MESGKVIGIIIAVVAVIVIIGLIIWWCGRKPQTSHSVDPRHVKCLSSIKKSLGDTSALSRMYIIEKFAESEYGGSTQAAVEKQYLATYREYFGGYNTDRSRSVTDMAMSKFALYDMAIEDGSQDKVARAEAHRINEDIALSLINCGKTTEASMSCSREGNCGKTSKIIEVLDSIDKANFDQIVFIHQGNYKASIESFYEADEATHTYFKWLVIAYCRCHGVDTTYWE